MSIIKVMDNLHLVNICRSQDKHRNLSAMVIRKRLAMCAHSS